MSRATRLCGALWIAVVGSSVQTGCIHNHYYGTAATIPGCPPTGSTVTTQTQLGSICDVPGGRVVTNSAGAMVTANEGDSTTRISSIAGSVGPSRVVISQPAQGPPSIGQSSGRIRWRRPDPETLPTLKAEGGLDDSISR